MSAEPVSSGKFAPLDPEPVGVFGPKVGLYDPSYEKDACGVGIVANLSGEPSHEVKVDPHRRTPPQFSFFTAPNPNYKMQPFMIDRERWYRDPGKDGTSRWLRLRCGLW